MDTIIFKYNLDFMTEHNLAEYASYITGINGIKVKFIEKVNAKLHRNTAMVDTSIKIIYLPSMEYNDQLDEDNYRLTKAYLLHECAHLMFPDNSKFVLKQFNDKNDTITCNFAFIIDDIRIENLMCKTYPKFQNDFVFLIDYLWNENYIPFIANEELREQRFGDYTCDMIGSLYWLLQKRYRKASLKPPNGLGEIIPFKAYNGMEQIINDEIAPLLDNFINTKESSWETAKIILEILKRNYPQIFNTVSITEESHQG